MPQISERIPFLLSAAQPTGQGEESVVVLVLVLVFGGPYLIFPCTAFLGEKNKNFVSKWM